MTPFTEGFRRSKEKLVNSALDMLSLKFSGRASWSCPEVYKNLKFKEEVQPGSMYLEGEDVHRSFTEKFLDCRTAFLTFSKKEILICPPHQGTVSESPRGQADFSSKGPMDDPYSIPGESH
ncbi:hypothetical protein MG293_000300 [Ovis ammon polii]|uniref:Uncharacterized protein n=1 Tax=Ovis ammon polii TaxID=230172 RepID=A0AAD4UQA9_OVIAM|nr:hypothetical protein MG293_000300 [Ovis ammon polii]